MAIELSGSKAFRHRIVLATMLGQTIRIVNIRNNEANPGIRDYEVDFFTINIRRTSVLYKPGIVTGGSFSYNCHLGRSLGYYIVPLLLILPFGKSATTITLKGTTNSNDDLSIDIIRSTTIPLLEKFVQLTANIVKSLQPIDLTDFGLIRSIRGVSYGTKISPQMSNRMGEACKGVLSRYLQDVYITSDHWKGNESGSSPGYGVTVTASSTTGCLISSELFGEGGDVPEDIGQKVACMLLKEVNTGGCVDVMHQPWMLILMTCCSEDVSKLRCGDLTLQAVECLRTIKEVTGVTFQVVWDESTKTSILSCVGIGYSNLSKKIH
ncbi:RNA 3'-terminal phosphate cyclase [Entamoeba marina]